MRRRHPTTKLHIPDRVPPGPSTIGPSDIFSKVVDCCILPVYRLPLSSVTQDNLYCLSFQDTCNLAHENPRATEMCSTQGLNWQTKKLEWVGDTASKPRAALPCAVLCFTGIWPKNQACCKKKPETFHRTFHTHKEQSGVKLLVTTEHNCNPGSSSQLVKSLNGVSIFIVWQKTAGHFNFQFTACDALETPQGSAGTFRSRWQRLCDPLIPNGTLSA